MAFIYLDTLETDYIVVIIFFLFIFFLFRLFFPLRMLAINENESVYIVLIFLPNSNCLII